MALPPSKVVIEEQAGRKRRLELQGSGQPLRGVEWGGEMRLVTDAIPGNDDDAIQQVLGPAELPSTWEGMWRTTRLSVKPASYSEAGGAPQKIALASTLVDVVDDMRRSGQLCRVTWSEGDRKQERLGRIARFVPKYDRFDDVAWELEWAWIGRGPSRQSVASFRQDQKAALAKSVALQLGQLTSEVEAAKLVTATQGVAFSASSFSLGGLEALLSAPKQLLANFSQLATQLASRITEVGKLIEGIEQLPADLAAQALDAATSITTACAEFNQAVSVYGPESLTSFDQSASVQGLLAAQAYFSGAQQQAEGAMAAAAALKVAAQKAKSKAPGVETQQGTAAPDILAVVVARIGDTFAKLASRFYGTPDKDAAIAIANGFQGYEIAPPVGAVIVVPNAQAASQLSA